MLSRAGTSCALMNHMRCAIVIHLGHELCVCVCAFCEDDHVARKLEGTGTQARSDDATKYSTAAQVVNEPSPVLGIDIGFPTHVLEAVCEGGEGHGCGECEGLSSARAVDRCCASSSRLCSNRDCSGPASSSLVELQRQVDGNRRHRLSLSPPLA